MTRDRRFKYVTESKKPKGIKDPLRGEARVENGRDATLPRVRQRERT